MGEYGSCDEEDDDEDEDDDVEDDGNECDESDTCLCMYMALLLLPWP